MTDELRCQSCSMTIESGLYCDHCTDDHGNLMAFAERMERFSQWIRSQNPGLERADSERQALAFMAKMPAWRDHPQLKEALSRLRL